MNTPITFPKYDLKNVQATNRLTGLWRLMNGFRLAYVSANLSLAFSAIFKTSTFLLLRNFADKILGQPGKDGLLPLIGLGFICLAALEGSFTFISGRLAAYTAEGVTLRLRNYLFDHIQRLSFAYHSKAKTGELIQTCDI